MNYNIISTGSKGNAVLIEESILIDCGISFKKIKDYYKKIQIVLLTHVHGDHFNKTTIKKLAFERPTLRFACGEWLVADLIDCGVSKTNIDIINFNVDYDYGLFKIRGFELYHDVQNCGYKIEINNKKIIYATDTNRLDHIDAKEYDLYLIEANYENEEIENRIKEKIENGEYVYEYRTKETHLSKESANDWLVKNMGNNSLFEYMHEHEKRDKIEI